MKIWLDAASESSSTLLDRRSLGECGDCSDCDASSAALSRPSSRGDCRPTFHDFLARISTGDEYGQGVDCIGDASDSEWLPSQMRSHIQTCAFKQTDSLYIQPCSKERWLVCNPTYLGHIAVMDQQAVALLERFCSPTTFLDLVQDSQDSSLTQIEDLLEIFYHLGFLQDLSHPQPSQIHRSSDTLSAWMHVTNACNLRCHYCYLDKTSQHMDYITAYKSIDAIFRSARRHHYKRILLKYAGGEASLQLTRVLAIHDYAVKQAHQQGIDLSAYIMSNGVALPQRVIHQVKMRCIGIMISLDGIGSDHDAQRPFINGAGSFKYVSETITRLLAGGLIPYINVTISQRNLEGLPVLMEYLLERDLPFRLSYYRDNDCSATWSDLQFKNDQMISGMRRAFAVLEQHLPQRKLISSLIDLSDMTDTHEHTCGVGRNYLVIDQHGGIAKCHADIEKTLTTIDAEDPLQIIQSDFNGIRGVSVEEKEGCRTCEWRYWCTGGCPLLTYRVTGRSDLRSPNCSIYKALYPDALRLEALRLLKYTSPIAL
jgi:uncharacterized protein